MLVRTMKRIHTYNETLSNETHWKDRGHFNTIDHTIYISGADKPGSNGVAFVVDKRMSKYVECYEPISDRIIKITFSSKPVKLHIIQVYMPTSSSSDDEVDAVYAQIENIIGKIPQKDMLVVMGDFNAKVGRIEHDDHLRHIVG